MAKTIIQLTQVQTKVRNKGARPKTAWFKSLPRYLNPIHGEAFVDESFKVKNFFYRDIALIRYVSDDHAQIFNEKQFINTFLLRNNDPYWRTVDYVQTNVKAKIGIGIPIVIKFYADLDDNSMNNHRILYDYK